MSAVDHGSGFAYRRVAPIRLRGATILAPDDLRVLLMMAAHLARSEPNVSPHRIATSLLTTLETMDDD